MTQPNATQPSENPPPEAAQASAEHPTRGGSSTALSRDLSDFLVEFSIVLHKRSMYPAGHPHLQDSALRFFNRMTALLETRESVTLGVARHRLIIESVTTDPNNALLREMAHRLHRHRIASVQLLRGPSMQEVEEVLGVLSTDPNGSEGPIGRRLNRVGNWEHIRLRAMGFDRFTLQQADSHVAGVEGTSAERDSWVELARLALSTEQESDAAEDADPLVVAEAIGQKSGAVAYDRVVLGYLSKLAEEMSDRRTTAEDQLSQRISRMIEALDPAALRRLLAAGADAAARRRFALNASQILAADAVLEVVEAAAHASEQTISHNLLRLLHKLAHHAEAGPDTTRAAADGALRTNVARLINNWQLDDPNPSRYNAILEGMVRRAPDEGANNKAECSPETIVKMALELGTMGPAVYTATEALLARRELVQLTKWLVGAPMGPAVDAIWSFVATPERLATELAATPLDPDAVAILVGRIGANAADSLLDHLATSKDRSTRAALLKQLVSLGPEAGVVAARRLPDAPWYLQRNILLLIARLGVWPPGFSPKPYAGHSDVRIRREAIKLLLETPGYTTEGVMLGLRDQDDSVASLAATAALESCPPQALPAIERLTVDPKRTPELRAITLRILARTRAPEALRLVLAAAVTRRFWIVPRLAPKSPLLMAALSALSQHWREHARARKVLAIARRHADAEIRAAAAPAPRA